MADLSQINSLNSLEDRDNNERDTERWRSNKKDQERKIFEEEMRVLKKKNYDIQQKNIRYRQKNADMYRHQQQQAFKKLVLKEQKAANKKLQAQKDQVKKKLANTVSKQQAYEETIKNNNKNVRQLKKNEDKAKEVLHNINKNNIAKEKTLLKENKVLEKNIKATLKRQKIEDNINIFNKKQIINSKNNVRQSKKEQQRTDQKSSMKYLAQKENNNKLQKQLITKSNYDSQKKIDLSAKTNKENQVIKDKLQEHNEKKVTIIKEQENKIKLDSKNHYKRQQQQIADKKSTEKQLQNQNKTSYVIQQQAERDKNDLNYNNFIYKNRDLKQQQKISYDNELKNKLHNKEENTAKLMSAENKQTQQLVETTKQNDNLIREQLKNHINSHDLNQQELKLMMAKKQTNDYNIKQKKDKKQDDIVIENTKLVAEIKPVIQNFDVNIAIVEALQDPNHRVEIINHIVELIRQSRPITLKDGLCNISIPGEFWEGTNVSVKIKKKDLIVQVNASENVESLLKQHRNLLCKSLQSIDVDLNVAVSIEKLAI